MKRVSTYRPSCLSCSYKEGSRILSCWTRLWSTSILLDQMLNLIDLMATDPALCVNRLRSYFNNFSPMNPRQQTTKSSVPKDIISWTCFSPKPLSLHLIPVFIMRLHAQTNFSPWMWMVKKETVLIDRVKQPFTDTGTQEPHIPSTYIFYKPTQTTHTTIHTPLSPTYVTTT